MVWAFSLRNSERMEMIDVWCNRLRVLSDVISLILFKFSASSLTFFLTVTTLFGVRRLTRCS